MDRPLIYKDRKGEWRWKVLAPDDALVAESVDGFPTDGSARRDLVEAGFLEEAPVDR